MSRTERDQALEDAAKLCDREREKFTGREETRYQANVCWRLAYEIRALIGKPREDSPAPALCSHGRPRGEYCPGCSLEGIVAEREARERKE